MARYSGFVTLSNGSRGLLPSTREPPARGPDPAIALLREQLAGQAAAAAAQALEIFPEWKRHFGGQRVVQRSPERVP
jgi:hypothetical protein